MVAWWNLKNPQGNEWNLLSTTNHEDHIAGEGFTSMSHYNLVHKLIRMSQAMKIPDAKAAVDKKWKSSRRSQHDLEKVKNKKEVILEALRYKKEGPLRYTDGHLSPGVGTKITEVQKQSRAPGSHCNGRLWSLRSLY